MGTEAKKRAPFTYEVDVAGITLRMKDREDMDVLLDALRRCEIWNGFVDEKPSWIKVAITRFRLVQEPKNDGAETRHAKI